MPSIVLCISTWYIILSISFVVSMVNGGEIQLFIAGILKSNEMTASVKINSIENKILSLLTILSSIGILSYFWFRFRNTGAVLKKIAFIYSFLYCATSKLIMQEYIF